MAAQLKAGALSLAGSLIMGVAGVAPGFSIAVALAGLLAASGPLAPGALVIFAVPTIGIAVAYQGLCAAMPNAGAAYEWTGRIFAKPFGFFSGWALLVGSVVFTVTGAAPLGTATLSFFPDPALVDNVALTTSIGAVWFVVIGLVLAAGISLSSRLQLVMSGVELAILSIVLVAAAIHTARFGAVNPPSWSWFGLNYPPSAFSASALIVVFLYWGWDVTANLGEESDARHNSAGNGGFLSVFVSAAYFLGFTVAALCLFSVRQGQSFSDNLIYHLALRAGLGRSGALAASFAVILSSIATLETQMLQVSRTLFAMGRDGGLPRWLGVVQARSQTPVRAMYLLLGLGLAMIFLASFMSSVSRILSESVKAIAVQVCYYYSVAGFACAWLHRGAYRRRPLWFVIYAVFPALSAISLIILACYALTTFDNLTRIVGVGGLLLGVVFYRPKGYRAAAKAGADL